MIEKYRKLPIVLEVIQFTMDNVEEIRDWMILNDSEHELIVSVSGSWFEIAIKTLEGEMNISENDYIIKGVGGEFYPCKPDIFHKTFEVVK